MNFRLAFAIAAGAFGSAFQHGYNTGVVNAPRNLIMDWINSDCNQNQTIEAESDDCLSQNTVTMIWSWIVSSFCVGGIIGGSAVGVVASRLGR